MAETFTCAGCGGLFEKEWSDQAAAAESRDTFGIDPNHDPTMAVICDDCYKAVCNSAWNQDAHDS